MRKTVTVPYVLIDDQASNRVTHSLDIRSVRTPMNQISYVVLEHNGPNGGDDTTGATWIKVDCTYPDET